MKKGFAMGHTANLIRSRFAILAVLLGSGVVAVACDTPVYRYAMYRWMPAPYELYCFHEGELDAASQQLQEAVKAASQDEVAPANIIFLPVDLSKDKELTSVPPDVKQAWLDQKSPALPTYLVSSPMPIGGHVHVGAIQQDQLPAMISSPVRQQIGKHMEQGDAGVYIVLGGADEAANKAAEATVQEVVKEVGSGKVPLYVMPPARGPEGEEADAESPEDQYKLTFGVVTASRDDPKERWLVNCLLTVERDLRECQDPIVFMVYGRGRVLFSCLGKGIHRDNLLQDIEFVTGACSCTVKEQNPGVDLLMSYNWDGVAQTLFEQYGTEEGSPYEFGGDALFPELIIPADQAMSEGGAPAAAEGASDAQEGDREGTETGETEMVADAGATDHSSGVTDGKATEDGVVNDDQGSKRDDSSETPGNGRPASNNTTSEETSEGTQVAVVTPRPGTGSAAESGGSMRGVLLVGAGLLAAFVVLLGATFIVLRPK